jgi:tRNA threonylcarbamoyladenosine biosynthesis protein TsaB
VIALGLESATELVGAAVADDAGLRAELWSTGRRRHVETLAPAVEAVLVSADVVLGALEAVVVDVGPGLFTGLRVGVATAQGLALGLGVGVLAVNSLEVLAAQALATWPGVVLSVVDARRGEVFTAAYERDGRLPRELLPPAVRRPEDLAGVAYEARAAARAGSPVLVVGDGARRYAHELVDADVVLAAAAFVGPSPGALVTLGVARLAAGFSLVAPETLRPLYLRPPDARINWVQRAPMEPKP